MKRALYIPGLGHEQLDISVKAYALRMMKAIDEHNPDSSKTYRIESIDKEYDSDGSISDVVSIFENRNGSEEEIYRFYEFKYGNLLVGRYKEANILFRFFSLFVVLVTRFLSVLRSLFSFKDEINKKSKVQAFYFAIIYCMLALYLVFLVPSLLALLGSFSESIEQLKFLAEHISKFETEYKAILASFAAFMLFTPNSKNILSVMATEYLAANQYLSIGDRRLLIMGKINRLIEVVSEEEENVKIEIHAYSFGSVLAIDALFPYEAEPNLRIKSNISRLITIGCPFDFIEIYWSKYFSDRKYSNLALSEWINIYSDLDVLSTKFDGYPAKRAMFINTDEFWESMGDIDVAYNMVNPKRVSFIQMLMFYGLKAHQTYWDKHVDSRSCLSQVVKT